VVQVLLRCDDEGHWLRAAPRLVGHLFPRLLAQSGYNTRLRQIAPLMEAALRGTAVVTDNGLSGQGTEEFFAADGLRLTLIRPARKDEKQPCPFPNWLRQRVEAVIWTLKSQLGLEPHGGRIPAELWARIIQRLLALNLHLAQLAHRRPGQTIPDRLRPHLNCPHFPINDLGRGLGIGPGAT
jgi:hypothetical protein